MGLNLTNLSLHKKKAILNKVENGGTGEFFKTLAALTIGKKTLLEGSQNHRSFLESHRWTEGHTQNAPV